MALTKVDPLRSSLVPLLMIHLVLSCSFSDRPIIWRHGERDDAHGLREGAGCGSSESELQQPGQSCGVPAHCKSCLWPYQTCLWANCLIGTKCTIGYRSVWFCAIVKLCVPAQSWPLNNHNVEMFTWHNVNQKCDTLFQGIPGRDQGHATGPEAVVPPVTGMPAASTAGISVPANTGSSPGAGGGKLPIVFWLLQQPILHSAQNMVYSQWLSIFLLFKRHVIQTVRCVYIGRCTMRIHSACYTHRDHSDVLRAAAHLLLSYILVNLLIYCLYALRLTLHPDNAPLN